MNPTHLIVADSSRARFFTCASGGLEEHEDLVSPAARLSEQDLTSDRPGRDRGRHPLPSQTSAKRHTAEDFARQTADRLAEWVKEQPDCRAMLIASPRFLGMLRDALDPQTQQHIHWQIDKDLSKHSTIELAEEIKGLV